MDGLILAIDVGTTMAKAVVFDLEGRSHGIARRPTPLFSPRPGWSEMDMEALWRLVVEISREAVTAARGGVAAISLSGISCGTWLVDAASRPVRPAILWNDGRCADTNAAWQKSGRLDAIYAIAGSVIYPGFTLPLLRWLDRNEPANLAAARAVLCCKDWIRLRMTGAIGTDESDASYMPCDVAGRGHSDALWELCEVERHAGLMPPINKSDTLAGVLSRAAAADMGLPPGLPVACGMTDLSAATVGAGVVAAGQACSTLGTSCLNSVVMDAPDYAPAGIGITGCTILGRWLRTFVNNAGTMNIDWALRTFLAGEEDPIAALGRETADIPAGAGGVLFHPYLSATGVVSPFVHPHAQGQFFGIRENHRRGHLLRAVLEGVAFAIRDCYAAMPQTPAEIRLVGGGARNPLWCQIIADCTGLPVKVPAVEEAGAWGAAMVGAAAAGMVSDLAEMAGTIAIRRGYSPDARSHALYTEMFALYGDIARSTQEHWSAHAAILRRLRD